jgi:hypothetical protein
MEDRESGAGRQPTRWCKAYKVLALQVELCSPRLIASRDAAPSGFRPGFWPQGQFSHSTPLSRRAFLPDPVSLGLLVEPKPLANLRHEAGHAPTLRLRTARRPALVLREEKSCPSGKKERGTSRLLRPRTRSAAALVARSGATSAAASSGSEASQCARASSASTTQATWRRPSPRRACSAPTSKASSEQSRA